MINDRLCNPHENKTMIKYLLVSSFVFFGFVSQAQPTISFTFDDGITESRGGFQFEKWNEMILQSLDKAKIKSVFFVKTEDKASEKGAYLLNSWNERGHKIANHTNSHPNFNRKTITAEDFRNELLKADSLIKNYNNYVKLFRFPYLKEGNAQAKIDSIRQVLKSNGYENGYVTIDASDWYVDSRLRKRLNEDAKADISAFKKFYLEHLFDRANFYEDLAFKLTGRHINHTLLLHHNLTLALFLSDLISMFKEKGWNVISADEAFKDPIFKQIPNHAGESLIWALAKDSGKFEDVLRYPAEDSRYEKDRMDELGL